MKKLISIHNPKGGTGKSMICKALCQYHIDRKTPFVAFDTDRNNPDVYRCYSSEIPVQLAILSEATRYEDRANSIFNAALENQKVIVNLPAQVHQPLKEWIEKNELLEIAADEGIQFHIFFVTDSGYDSLLLLQKTLELYQERMTYTVIRNYGRSDDFESLETHAAVQALIRQYQATVIDFPMLTGSVVRNRLDSESLSFGAALRRPDWSLIEKQRIRKFLREAYASFDQTEAFCHDS